MLLTATYCAWPPPYDNAETSSLREPNMLPPARSTRAVAADGRGFAGTPPARSSKKDASVFRGAAQR